MHERQEHRLQSEVVPIGVEGRGPHQHAPVSHLALDQRGIAVVEAGEDLVLRFGPQLAVAEESRGAEVSAARLGEGVEGRMVAIERGDPRDARPRLGRFATRRRRRQTGRSERGVGTLAPAAERDHQTAALLDEGLQPAHHAGVECHVAHHHRGRLRQIVAPERAGGTTTHLDHRLLPQPQRLLDVETARTARGPAVVDQDHRQRLGTRQREEELVVGGEPVALEDEPAARDSLR